MKVMTHSSVEDLDEKSLQKLSLGRFFFRKLFVEILEVKIF